MSALARGTLPAVAALLSVASAVGSPLAAPPPRVRLRQDLHQTRAVSPRANPDFRLPICVVLRSHTLSDLAPDEPAVHRQHHAVCSAKSHAGTAAGQHTDTGQTEHERRGGRRTSAAPNECADPSPLAFVSSAVLTPLTLPASQRVFRGWLVRRSVVHSVRREFAAILADVDRRATTMALRAAQAQGGTIVAVQANQHTAVYDHPATLCRPHIPAWKQKPRSPPPPPKPVAAAADIEPHAAPSAAPAAVADAAASPSIAMHASSSSASLSGSSASVAASSAVATTTTLAVQALPSFHLSPRPPPAEVVFAHALPSFAAGTSHPVDASLALRSNGTPVLTSSSPPPPPSAAAGGAAEMESTVAKCTYSPRLPPQQTIVATIGSGNSSVSTPIHSGVLSNFALGPSAATFGGDALPSTTYGVSRSSAASSGGTPVTTSVGIGAPPMANHPHSTAYLPWPVATSLAPAPAMLSPIPSADSNDGSVTPPRVTAAATAAADGIDSTPTLSTWQPPASPFSSRGRFESVRLLAHPGYPPTGVDESTAASGGGAPPFDAVSIQPSGVRPLDQQIRSVQAAIQQRLEVIRSQLGTSQAARNEQQQHPPTAMAHAHSA